MKSKTDKKVLIAQQGKELFFKFGVRKVTVEEICSRCGISKKTFYKFYKNKYRLIEEILDSFILEDNLILSRIRKENISFKDKFLKLTQEKMKRYVTAEAIFFKDVIENCPELTDYVAKVTSDAEREFFQFVSEEQEMNNLRKDLPASFISYLLGPKITDLIFDKQVEKMLPDFNDRVLQVIDCLINGIEGNQ